MTASPPDVASLRQRLEELERNGRRWRWACAGLLLATLIVVVEGTDWIRTRQHLVAHELVLRDSAGRVRAQLAAEETPGLILYDEKGREHLRLQARPDGSARLSLLDSGLPRGEISVQPDGSARIGMINDDFQVASGIVVTPDGDGSIMLGGRPFPPQDDAGSAGPIATDSNSPKARAAADPSPAARAPRAGGEPIPSPTMNLDPHRRPPAATMEQAPPMDC